MSASEIQRLRAGAAAQANRRTVATPPPPSVQLQQQPAAQRGMQASVSNIQMASAWGMADEEVTNAPFPRYFGTPFSLDCNLFHSHQRNLSLSDTRDFRCLIRSTFPH